MSCDQRVGMKIAFKYCGHCRPFLDMARLPELLRRAREFPDYVSLDDVACEVVVRLNACPSACASIPDFAGPQIEVTYETEDRSEAAAYAALVHTICEALDRVETHNGTPTTKD